MDVVAVHEAARRACEHVRDGEGPVFVEFRTYRFRAHSMFDPELYRDKAEVEQWKTRGPIHTFSARLKAQGELTEEQFLALDAAATAEVDARGGLRRGRHAGSRSRTSTRDVYRAHDDHLPRGAAAGPARGARRAIARVFLMGEDVGKYGGTYAVSKGLLEEFGPERVRDTPLSELGFVGRGHRRRARRHAADRRGDDGELQPARRSTRS